MVLSVSYEKTAMKIMRNCHERDGQKHWAGVDMTKHMGHSYPVTFHVPHGRQSRPDAFIRQSRPDSGLGIEVRVFTPVLSSLERSGHDKAHGEKLLLGPHGSAWESCCSAHTKLP